MPSTICAKLYKNIQADFIEYSDCQSLKKKEKDNVEKENWNKGNKRKRVEESYYFNNHDFLNVGKLKKINFDDIECPEFVKTYGKYLNNNNFENNVTQNTQSNSIEKNRNIIEDFLNFGNQFFFTLLRLKNERFCNIYLQMTLNI